MGSFSFAPIFGDGMVLQRDKELTVWGTSDGEGTVRVSLGDFRSESVVTGGVWKCTFPPMKAAAGLTLLAKQAAQTIRVRDVMIGEVWLAGGQSNMEFFLRYESHWKEAQSLPKNHRIRMYTCPRIAYGGQAPFQKAVGCWFGEGDPEWETFAAAAYWFARELQPALDVPVGIVSCNWGGTSASAWIPVACLSQSPLDVYLEDYEAAAAGKTPEELQKASMRGWAFQQDPGHLQEWARVMYGIDRQSQLERNVRCADNPVVPMGPYHKNRPGCLYEQMILPIRDYAIKGVLWYQGENDVHHAPLYSCLFTALIAQWRNIWGPDIPFIFAQLAPFERWLTLDGEGFPELRRQQELVSRTVPNCWMISTSDAGMRYDIHPKEKKVLGHRFFLQAVDKVYGKSCLADAPEVRGRMISGNTISLRFANAGDKLDADGDISSLFEVTQDGEPVQIVNVIGDSVVLTVPGELQGSVKVSFAQKPYYEVCLMNSGGIPLMPFRS